LLPSPGVALSPIAKTPSMGCFCSSNTCRCGLTCSLSISMPSELEVPRTYEWVFSSFETPVKLLMNGLGDKPVDQTSRPYGTIHQLRSDIATFHSPRPSPSSSSQSGPTAVILLFPLTFTPSRLNLLSAYFRKFLLYQCTECQQRVHVLVKRHQDPRSDIIQCDPDFPL
jgi:hypothetical protein